MRNIFILIMIAISFLMTTGCSKKSVDKSLSITASPSGGVYSSGVTVTLSASRSGALIYYKATSVSAKLSNKVSSLSEYELYTGPITLSTDSTIEFYGEVEVSVDDRSDLDKLVGSGNKGTEVVTTSDKQEDYTFVTGSLTDSNGDGIADTVDANGNIVPVLDASGNTITVGDSVVSYTYSFTELFSQSYTGSEINATMGNFNNNSTPDLAVVQNGTLTTYNDFYQGFTAVDTFATGITQPYVMLPVDFDGNGYKGVYITGQINYFTTVTKTYRSLQNGHLEEHDYGITGGLAYSCGIVADIRGTGKDDLIVIGQEYPTISGGFVTLHNKVYLNNGDGTGFTEVTNNGLPLVYSCSIKAADFNNDGKLDLFITGTLGETSNYTRVLLGDGTGHFTESYTASSEVMFASALIADFNNDDKQDILILGLHKNEDYTNTFVSKIGYGDGHGGFTENDASGIPLMYPAYGDSFVMSDIKGDGSIALVVQERFDTEVWGKGTIYWYQGNGVFSKDAVEFNNDNFGFGHTLVDDINGDGTNDMVFLYRDTAQTKKISVYETVRN